MRLWALALCVAMPSSAVTLVGSSTSECASIERIGPFAFSATGSLLVWQSVRDAGTNGPARRIWLADPESGEVRALVEEERAPAMPRWRPGGSVVSFLAPSKGEITQVFTVDPAGGAPQPVTDSPTSVVSYAWSPDGHRLTYIADTPQSEAARQSAANWHDVDHDDPLPGLWELAVETGQTRQLLRGAWRVHELVSAPDRSGVFFIGTRSLSQERYSDELFFLPADASDEQAPQSLHRFSGRATNLAISTDGHWLSWLGGRQGGSPHDLHLFSPAQRAWRNATAKSIDQAITRTLQGGDGYAWMPDGRLLVTYALGYASGAAYLHVDGARQHFDLPLASVSSVAVDPQGHWTAVAASTTTALPEVYIRKSGRSWVRLSALNANFQAADIQPLDIFTYRSFDGRAIEGALITPQRENRKLPPLVVYPHGGPAGRWSDDYEPWGQYLAAHGYAVFYPNVRGSIGYGYAFMSMARKDWGGGDYRDLMAGVDALIAAGKADARRLAIVGWSYGGYLGAWAITQTNRFRGAVLGAGMYDLASEFGTEAAPAYDEWYLGTPYDDPELFAHRSPLWHIRNVRTPTLIVHGEFDTIDPPSQARQLYRGLKWLGVPTELVLYPGSGHFLTRAAQQSHLCHRSREWLDRYVGDAERTGQPTHARRPSRG